MHSKALLVLPALVASWSLEADKHDALVPFHELSRADGVNLARDPVHEMEVARVDKEGTVSAQACNWGIAQPTAHNCDHGCDSGHNRDCDSSCDGSCDNWCDHSCDYYGASCDHSCNLGCDGDCNSGCDGNPTSSCDDSCDSGCIETHIKRKFNGANNKGVMKCVFPLDSYISGQKNLLPSKKLRRQKARYLDNEKESLVQSFCSAAERRSGPDEDGQSTGGCSGTTTGSAEVSSGPQALLELYVKDNSFIEAWTPADPSGKSGIEMLLDFDMKVGFQVATTGEIKAEIMKNVGWNMAVAAVEMKIGGTVRLIGDITFGYYVLLKCRAEFKTTGWNNFRSSYVSCTPKEEYAMTGEVRLIAELAIGVEAQAMQTVVLSAMAALTADTRFSVTWASDGTPTYGGAFSNTGKIDVGGSVKLSGTVQLPNFNLPSGAFCSNDVDFSDENPAFGMTATLMSGTFFSMCFNEYYKTWDECSDPHAPWMSLAALPGSNTTQAALPAPVDWATHYYTAPDWAKELSRKMEKSWWLTHTAAKKYMKEHDEQMAKMALDSKKM